MRLWLAERLECQGHLGSPGQGKEASSGLSAQQRPLQNPLAQEGEAPPGEPTRAGVRPEPEVGQDWSELCRSPGKGGSPQVQPEAGHSPVSPAFLIQTARPSLAGVNVFCPGLIRAYPQTKQLLSPKVVKLKNSAPPTGASGAAFPEDT